MVCHCMVASSHGIGKKEILELVNGHTHHSLDECMCQPTSMSHIEGLIGWHKVLVKLVKASSMDPKWANQAMQLFASFGLHDLQPS